MEYLWKLLNIHIMMKDLIYAHRERAQGLGRSQKFLGRQLNKIFELVTITHVARFDDCVYVKTTKFLIFLSFHRRGSPV